MKSRSARSAFSDRIDYEHLAIELVVALRGKRSRRDFSRKLGYKSNIVQRWETGVCQPRAAAFLAACERGLKRGLRSAYAELYQRPAPWARRDEDSRRALVVFLLELRADKRVGDIAAACGRNRFTVSRWFKGTAEPTLAELLQLVDVLGDRLLDFISALADPKQLPSVSIAWHQLERSRNLAYQNPWGHAVIRALRLEACPAVGIPDIINWLADRLHLEVGQVSALLEDLQLSGHVRWTRTGWKSTSPARINTGRDPALGNRLKQHWISVALARVREGGPGSFGYSLFEVSRSDLGKVKALHLAYVRAMQEVVANSKGTDRLALYCAQLLDLSVTDNAL